MKTKHTHENIDWISLVSPTPEEARSISEDYNVHPVVANELLSSTYRPRVDVHNKYIYLILHFPAFSHEHNEKHTQEINLIIGKDFLITAQYGELDAMHEFKKVFESDSILKKEGYGEHAGFLFFHLVRHLYRTSHDELEVLSRRLADIENRIFSGEEHAMVEELSRVGRELLDFHKAFRLHGNIIDSFEAAARDLFGEEFVPFVRSLNGEFEQIAEDMHSNTETLKELRRTNDSLLSTKINDIMRVLTIMAFITFPLTLITSIFGMNTQTLPIVGQPNDFWIIIGIMTAATVGFFGFFKYKNWL